MTTRIAPRRAARTHGDGLRKGTARRLVGVGFWLCAMGSAVGGTRQMEGLNRGLVAVVRADTSVYLGWRLLASDRVGVSFHVYRAVGDGAPVRLTTQPLAKGTNWVHEAADLALPSRYTVRSVVAGKEGSPCPAAQIPAKAPAKPYFAVPLQTPDGYLPNDASVGDLDGDGQYEIVIHQTGRAHDNSHAGETDPPVLQAYKLDGAHLWEINLGRNIREGAHYTQFIVYDLDGDGRAEVACKTADGTVDGRGTVLGDPKADHRSKNGYILRGPEFLTVFDGRTGAALATTDYVPPRAPGPTHTRAQIKAIWGDDYGNRVDRFLAGVAYLDGERPSLIMCRGYYTRSVLAAWDWRDGKLTLRWVFDSADGTPGNKAYTGQGNHNLAVADVDGDGKDEIVYGACTIDDNGTGLYSTGLGHGDAIHVSDIDPARPGLEVWGIHEHPKHPHGVNLRDAATGEILWSKPSPDVGRGMSMDVDPRHPGYECWAAGRGVRQLYNCRGEVIAGSAPWCNMGIWWDGDLLREVLDGVTIAKWDIATEKTVPILEAKAFDCARNNGTKANPCLAADILGDWREELVCRTTDGKELRIFTTAIPTTHRLVTLMQDPVYRLSVAAQNVGYNLPAQPGFYLGEGKGAATPALPSHPTVYLIGDSTVNTRGGGKLGWGTPFAKLVAPDQATAHNRARGGRSSRTYFSEGLWAAVLAQLKPGDFVFMQFGHNDGGGLNRNRSRGSIKGTGEETQELVDEKTGAREVVHTYGWYLRRYCNDALAKGATPVVFSPIPRNRWSKEGAVYRSSGDYGKWSRESAVATGAVFVDLNEIVSQHYEKLGKAAVAEKFFHPDDWTHTTPEGAAQNASCVAKGLAGISDRRLVPLQRALRHARPPPAP